MLLIEDELVDLHDSAVFCEFFDISKFNSTKYDGHNSIAVFHLNIRSYNANSTELIALLSQLNKQMDVIILTETWFSRDYIDSIAGYDAFHCYRDDRCGGGVSIFVNLKLNCKKVQTMVKSNEAIELLIVNLLSQCNATLNIVGVYRPPSHSLIGEFNREMELVTHGIGGSENYIICGDFNIDLFEPTAAGKIFIDLMRSSSFYPCISLPTRVTASTSTLIDNFWCNSLSVSLSGVFTCDISDHYPIFLFHPFLSEYKADTKYFRDHSSNSLSALYEEVRAFKNNFVNYANINDRVTYFCEELKNIYNRCCPIRQKTMSFKRFNKPWLNNNIICMINHKHYLFRE